MPASRYPRCSRRWPLLLNRKEPISHLLLTHAHRDADWQDPIVIQARNPVHGRMPAEAGAQWACTPLRSRHHRIPPSRDPWKRKDQHLLPCLSASSSWAYLHGLCSLAASCSRINRTDGLERSADTEKCWRSLFCQKCFTHLDSGLSGLWTLYKVQSRNWTPGAVCGSGFAAALRCGARGMHGAPAIRCDP